MDEQQIINRGSDAEQFKRYLEDNPYFGSVIELARQLIAQNIDGLKPDEQMKFTILRSQSMAISMLLDLIEMDIEAGQKALGRMQGKEVKEGTYGEGDVL